jgi:hypothetical protein
MIPGRKPMGGPMGIAPMTEPMMGPMDIGPREPGGPGAPPNLRAAEAEGESCGDCRRFSGRACEKFGGYPVEAAEVCDGFEPAAAMASAAADPYEMEAS